MGQNSTDLGTEFMVMITSTRVAGSKIVFSVANWESQFLSNLLGRQTGKLAVVTVAIIGECYSCLHVALSASILAPDFDFVAYYYDSMIVYEYYTP